MKLTPGELITEIELPSIDGETFSIKTIRGKKIPSYILSICDLSIL
jgi:peroxiredoxin